MVFWNVVKSLPQADHKAEENPKNENSSPYLVVCWIASLVFLLFLLQILFWKKDFLVLLKTDVLYSSVASPRGLGACAYWVNNIHIFIHVFLAVVFWQDPALN